MLELSRARDIGVFYEIICFSRGMQKQFELLKVRVIEESSHLECNLINPFRSARTQY